MRLLLDTNLLMLFVAGRANRRIIAVHKRLRHVFDDDDYDWLTAYIARYDGLTITPNTATESSNLLAQIADPYCADLPDALRTFVLTTPEIYIPSATAASGKEYDWLGLSDAAILCALGPETAMLTTDLGLYRAAAERGLSAATYPQARFADAS